MRDLIEELKALADPSRLRIVSLVWEAEDLCSCEIEKILDLKQSNASRHLYRLRSAGLLDSYKKAQWTHYTIPQERRNPKTRQGASGEHGGDRDYAGYRGFVQEIVLAAREEQEIFHSDIERLWDYRNRGFTCATIHEWIPFKEHSMKNKETSVLFICIHNSARSQMAETFLNDLGGGRFKAESAGLEPGTLNPMVVKAMAEEGYDISKNSTNSVFDYHKEGRSFDVVVAVCSKEAEERCPIFPGTGTRLHWPFDDPSSFAGSEEERLEATRRVRDQIKAKILEFIEEYTSA